MFKRITSSAAHLRDIRYLALMALFIAMRTALSSLYIPVGENLRILVTFIPAALEASIIGPVPALVSGALADIIGYMLFPSGAFFPGYTVSAMAGSFIYALFFYERNISVLRIALAKLIVNAFVNVGLGSLWSAIQFSKGYIYYMAKSVVKNSILLPIEIIILILMFNLLLPVMKKRKLVPSAQVLPVPWK